MAQTTAQTMNAPQRRKLEINQRQKILLIGMLLFLVIFGVIGTTYGFIGDEPNSQTSDLQGGSTIEMPVASANIKPMEDVEKEGSSMDELNPTSVSGTNQMAMDGGFNTAENVSLPNPSTSGNIITDKNNLAGPQSNNYTLEQEKGIQGRFDAFERNAANNSQRQAYGYAGGSSRKQTRTEMNNEALAYVNKDAKENSTLINDIYSGKPTADYQRKMNQDAVTKQERQARSDKYDDMLMKMVDNQNKPRESNPNSPSQNPYSSNSDDGPNQEVTVAKNTKVNQVAGYTKNRKPVLVSAPKTEDEDFEAAFSGDNPASGTLVKSDAGFPQIVSAKSENAFYGLNGKRTEVNKKRGRYETVEGVIHGSGDGVTVSNGSTIKIRITSETKLQLQGEELVLQPNTLITGVCAISGDRINIKVNSLRIENFLYPVTMMVYDLDGQQGIYVKDLAQKTQLSSALVQSAGQTMQPSYFIGQGSGASQVGTQLATSTLQNVSNVGRNLLTTKIAQVKAFVRPNYRVLLKFMDAKNSNN